MGQGGVYKVKADWSDMVEQTGTFERCTLVSILNRRYALVVALKQKDNGNSFAFSLGGLMAYS
jgi:hypothetical protein